MSQWSSANAPILVSIVALYPVVACSDSTAPEAAVKIADLGTFEWLYGPQITRLEIHSSVDVERSELFLEGLRIAADEFAPFELHWDTRDFGEGSYELRARIFLADGTHADGRVSIAIDNSPPMVSASNLAYRGSSFRVSVTDGIAIDRVEASREGSSEPPIGLTLDRPPMYSFVWPWPCGPTPLRIRAVNMLGDESTTSFAVTSVDLQDINCPRP